MLLWIVWRASISPVWRIVSCVYCVESGREVDEVFELDRTAAAYPDLFLGLLLFIACHC